MLYILNSGNDIDIFWHDLNNIYDRIEVFRTYKLNEEGYFQVLQERIILEAFIDDPDGYTNVRESPSTNSPILYRINKDEIFLAEQELVNDNWYKVVSGKRWDKNYKVIGECKEGYIHKSRTKFIIGN